MLQGAKESIIVVGGSIAGLMTAIPLLRQGHRVHIFERSKRLLDGRGAGVTVPTSMIADCIKDDLFGPKIPSLTISKRSFYRKYDFAHNFDKPFWVQNIGCSVMNWSHVYGELLPRLPNEHYITGKEVVGLKQNKVECTVQTIFENYNCDRVVVANGAGSTLTTALFPDISPQYAPDYFAWRGLVKDPHIVNHKIFDDNMPTFVFPNGHLILYKIPALDLKEMLLNWIFYEYRPDLRAKEFLIDNEGQECAISIPPGKLSEKNTAYLHRLAREVLPEPIANIICQTPFPFIQAIFDKMPTFLDGRICCVGDAAALNRPHGAFGLANARRTSKTLVEALQSENRNQALLQWRDEQSALAERQMKTAQRMGRGMVTNPPNWYEMDSASTTKWFEKHIMAGETHYALSEQQLIPTTNSHIPMGDDEYGVSPTPHFTPSRDKEMDKLTREMNFMKLSTDEPSFAPKLNKG